MHLKTRLLVVFAAAALGCNHSSGHGGADGGADGIPGLASIAVTPSQVTLTIDGTTPVTQSYAAEGTFVDGHKEDISSRVAWTLSSSGAGTFAGTLFTSSTDQGGLVSVIASAGTISGTGALTLILKQRYNDPGSPSLPPTAGTTIGNGPPSTTDSVVPRLVYPDDNVLVPPNLGRLEVHFTPGGDGNTASANTLFEVSFENAVTDVKVYMRCPTPPAYTDSASTPAVLNVQHGCIYTTDTKLWHWLAETNRGGDPVTVTVRGSDDAGTAVGTSKSTHVSFSLDDIQGALYYWEIGPTQPCVNGVNGSTGPGCSAGGDDTAIVRYDFAGTDDTAKTFLTPQTAGSTGGTCLGCHALSHDGTQLVAEAGGQADGRALLWNVATNMPMVPFLKADRTFFESWNPDGSQYVGVNNYSSDPSQDGVNGGGACGGPSATCDLNLRIYDGKTSKFVADVPGTSINGLPADHPDWSLDGSRIAYTLVGKNGNTYPTTLQQGYNGSIYVVNRNGGGWDAPINVVTPPDAHTNYYYPALAPDNSFLVMNRAQCLPAAAVDASCWFDTAPTSKLFAALPQANAQLVELTNANKPGPMDKDANITNSYPKWSPFTFRRSGEFGSRLMWLTFASKRRFGLRAQPATINRNKADGEIVWMVGIDPDKISQGLDGSYVAFALPFQRLYKSNHIAQWTQKIVIPIT